MRIKVVIAVLILCVLGFAGIYFLNRPASQSKPEAEPTTEITSTPKEAAPEPTIAASTAVPILEPATNAPEVVTATTTNEVPAEPQSDAEIKAKIDRLEDLQANYDKESLKEILTELINPNPQVRHAAVEATIQFRDRAAIPVLKELAAQTTNPEERQELLDAAEFLSLPTISELQRASQQ